MNCVSLLKMTWAFPNIRDATRCLCEMLLLRAWILLLTYILRIILVSILDPKCKFNKTPSHFHTNENQDGLNA